MGESCGCGTICIERERQLTEVSICIGKDFCIVSSVRSFSHFRMSYESFYYDSMKHS